MLPEIDIWRAAMVLVARFGNAAATRAAKRADELLDQGDIEGVVVWRRIMGACEQLSRNEPEPDRSVH